MFIYCRLYRETDGKRYLFDCFYVGSADSANEAQRIIDREKKYDLSDSSGYEIEYVIQDERY